MSSTTETDVKCLNPSSLKTNDIPGRESMANTQTRLLNPPACVKHGAAWIKAYKARCVVEAPSQNGETELRQLVTQSKLTVMEALFDEDNSNENKPLHDGL
jgi:short-subunit dehydrogenase